MDPIKEKVKENKIEEILLKPEVKAIIDSISRASNQGKPDYSMLRTDNVAIDPDTSFAKLTSQDQALVDRQIQRNLHAARDVMGYPDKKSAELGSNSGSSHMFEVGQRLAIQHQQCRTPIYVAEYTNNARESFANNPELIAGLRRNEEMTRQMQDGRGNSR